MSDLPLWAHYLRRGDLLRSRADNSLLYKLTRRNERGGWIYEQVNPKPGGAPYNDGLEWIVTHLVADSVAPPGDCYEVPGNDCRSTRQKIADRIQKGWPGDPPQRWVRWVREGDILFRKDHYSILYTVGKVIHDADGGVRFELTRRKDGADAVPFLWSAASVGDLLIPGNDASMAIYDRIQLARGGERTPFTKGEQPAKVNSLHNAGQAYDVTVKAGHTHIHLPTGEIYVSKCDDDPESNARKRVLDAATRAVLQDRNNTYGPPEQDFRRAAGILNSLGYAKLDGDDLPVDLTPTDIARIAIAIKLSRSMWSDHEDNWIDVAGYAACAAECEEIEANDEES